LLLDPSLHLSSLRVADDPLGAVAKHCGFTEDLVAYLLYSMTALHVFAYLDPLSGLGNIHQFMLVLLFKFQVQSRILAQNPQPLVIDGVDQSPVRVDVNTSDFTLIWER
jgi:hypothetical protein